MAQAAVLDSQSPTSARATEGPGIGAAAEKPKATRSKKPFVLGGLLLAAAVGGFGWFSLYYGREHTDDAQIDADLVALPARVGGVVTEVKFADNEHVAQDQILAVLEDDLPKARLAEAEAQLAAAEAQAAAADADAAIAERTAVTQKSAAKATLYGASAGANQSRDQIGAAEAMARASEAGVRQAELVFKRAEQLAASGAVTTSEFDAAKNALDGARANLDQAKANVAVVKTQTQSADSRVAEANAKYSQLSDVDAYILQAKSRAATAHAQVKTAEASRNRARLDLSYTVIKAPRAGVLSKRTIAVGQNIATGQAIATLLPDDALWVTANFKETQIGAMRAGQRVKLEVDAYASRDFEGEVESFAAATGSRFALLPPDNASGNFTKVVQRVPVRIRIVSPHGPELALRPGMSVVVSVDVRK